jgi:hypothetical protein
MDKLYQNSLKTTQNESNCATHKKPGYQNKLVPGLWTLLQKLMASG